MSRNKSKSVHERKWSFLSEQLSEKIRNRIRLGLWVAGLAWAAYFLLFALLLMPSFMVIVRKFYVGVFPVGVFGVTYVLALVIVTVIFFWFAGRLFRRKK